MRDYDFEGIIDTARMPIVMTEEEYRMFCEYNEWFPSTRTRIEEMLKRIEKEGLPNFCLCPSSPCGDRVVGYMKPVIKFGGKN